MNQQSGHHLERIANLTSLAVAALFAFTIPAGYFLISQSHVQEELQGQADVAANAISELIYRNPEYWSFQEHRLQDVLSTATWRREHLYYEINDERGEDIIAVGESLVRPSTMALAELIDGEKRVGEIQVSTSLRPLLEATVMVSLAGALLAWLIHYLLKVLPFAALRRVMLTLSDSQGQLMKEVEAKENALEEAMAMGEKMYHQARHDALTGLPNRFYFHEQAQALIRAATEDQGLAILFLDLNRFKEINDTLGHEAGDRLLVAVARRLQNALADSIFFARLGGDEFAVLVPEVDCEAARKVAEKVAQALKPHMALEGYHIAVHASVGIACYPAHGTEVVTLMRHADMAMYHSKTRGVLISFYDQSYDSSSPSRLTLAADLRHALDQQGLRLHYQPKIQLSTGAMVGAEALARWQHPEYGAIPPDLFIGIAEQSGMINDLTAWVLETSIAQMPGWREQGKNLHVAVNISAHNLQDEGLAGRIERLLSQYGVAAADLVLEITESSIMSDPQKAEHMIKTLSALGIRIAIDDFGTGYSSLAYLKRLTVDELKIDKSFVLNMLDNAEDQVIVRSTIELAHNLGMTLVAEGIENEETAALLKTYGCEVGQGFHYCRPMEADKLLACMSEVDGVVLSG